MRENFKNTAKTYVSDEDIMRHEEHILLSKELTGLFRRTTEQIFTYNQTPEVLKAALHDAEEHAELLRKGLEDPLLKAQVHGFLGKLVQGHSPGNENQLPEITSRYESATRIISVIGSEPILFSLQDHVFYTYDHTLELVDTLLESPNGTYETNQPIVDVLMKQIRQSKDINLICRLLQTIYRADQSTVLRYQEECMEKYHFNSDVHTDLWRFGEGDPLDSKKLCIDHFRAFIEIEETHPGLCTFLWKNFGIVFYGRYPKEVLVAQQAEFEDLKPYGVIMYAQDDHNGAFNDQWHIRDIYQQLKGKLAIRIVEVSTLQSAVRALAKMNRRYSQNGAGHTIQFMTVGGHGTSHSIQLGDQDTENSHIFTSDFERPGAERLGTFFKEDATVILESCSTGDIDGIGQKISELLPSGVKVIAPKIPIGGERLSAKQDEAGKWIFDVHYRQDSVKAVYKAGSPTED